MITDTCRCGASVMIKYKRESWEERGHTLWLEEHEVCRRLVTTKLDGAECTTAVDLSNAVWLCDRDADDAARFAWILSGRATGFMDNERLCGHGPTTVYERNQARDMIDAEMATQ